VTAPIPAATLVLMRDRPGAPPELLMVERAAAMRFAGGALVFPGGRVDPEDRIGRDDEAAARTAAVRETIEEAGIAVDVAALVPFARWLPAGLGHDRVFDTRFYLARAPEGAAPVVDGSENVRAFWASASEVLAAADRGDARVIFPTRRNLERLARFDSYEAALADALAHPVEIITPWREARGGVPHLCIPEGLGYPVTSEPFAGAMRG
jgi:8-oxo-dGTP pyrophosphatase MutT (NUDIX family)